MSSRMLLAIAAIAFTSALLMSSSTMAQGQTRFRVLDSNRDGVVSRSEWPGSDESFGERDRDADGVLSRDEVREGAAAVGGFTFADLDGNGEVTAQEWMRAFNDLDRDRDGVLSEDELSLRSESPWSADDPAFQAGFERGISDGRIAGRGDRERLGRWDLEGQRELEQANAGYRVELGGLAEYQAGYRKGFRQGYAEGYGPRR